MNGFFATLVSILVAGGAVLAHPSGPVLTKALVPAAASGVVNPESAVPNASEVNAEPVRADNSSAPFNHHAAHHEEPAHEHHREEPAREEPKHERLESLRQERLESNPHDHHEEKPKAEAAAAQPSNAGAEGEANKKIESSEPEKHSFVNIQGEKAEVEEMASEPAADAEKKEDGQEAHVSRAQPRALEAVGPNEQPKPQSFSRDEELISQLSAVIAMLENIKSDMKNEKSVDAAKVE